MACWFLDNDRVDSLLSELDDVQQADTATGLRLYSGTFPAGEHDWVWRWLRAEHPRTGLWPVLDWTAEDAAESTYRWPADAHGPAWVSAALKIDPAEQMALIVRSQFEWSIEDLDPAEDASLMQEYRNQFDPQRVAATVGPLSAVPPGIRRMSDSYPPPATVLLVPAAAGYEVPGLVPDMLFTNNWCGGQIHPDLSRADHLAVLRHWQTCYGAELYLAWAVDLELTVARPPRNPLEVAQCAIEQYSYCDDLEQILGDVHDVARRQAPSDHWSFWWD